MPWQTLAHRSAVAILALATVALSSIGAQAQGKSNFDGTWSVMSSLSERCVRGATFTITIKGSKVWAPGGRGSITEFGRIQFASKINTYTGTFRGDSGSGTYRGRCVGTFAAKRL
jgi:hypothetical protein